MTRFPARNRVPEFATFASLLRMTTKYGFSDVREQLVDSIKGAYPTKWEDFEDLEPVQGFRIVRAIGEAVFGSPRPHPNAVLNLFLEQNVECASPFAAYRAALGGLPSLASGEPGAMLPRPTLASIVHGLGEIQQMRTIAAHNIVYVGNRGVCLTGMCNLTVHTGQRMETLNKVYNAMVGGSGSDMLSSPNLRGIVCVDCANRLETVHLNWRKQFFWARLPRLLGWKSWLGI